MPIYEYVCDACGERFDKLFLSIKRIPAEIECPQCQSVDVQRVMSAPAVRSGDGAAGTAIVEDSTPAKPPVIGRKEIQAAQEKKRQLREQAKYGE
ncbi:MAG: hypothetical protein KDI79_14145 [Anaerolineae bacterium]|nr:hypothetical protein [Anaerolineae bacterium]